MIEDRGLEADVLFLGSGDGDPLIELRSYLAILRGEMAFRW